MSDDAPSSERMRHTLDVPPHAVTERMQSVHGSRGDELTVNAARIRWSSCVSSSASETGELEGQMQPEEHGNADANFFLSVVDAEPFIPSKSRYRIDLLDCGPNAASSAECLMHLAEAWVPSLNQFRNGRTSLHSQIINGNDDVCRAILLRPDFFGVNTACHGSTALHHVARSGKTELVRLIITRPGFQGINDYCRAGWTALQWAAGGGHTKTCEVLMSHSEIDLNRKSRGGWTALHRAAVSGHEEICRQILMRPQFVEEAATVYSCYDWSVIGTAREIAAARQHMSVVQAIDELRTIDKAEIVFGDF